MIGPAAPLSAPSPLHPYYNILLSHSQLGKMYSGGGVLKMGEIGVQDAASGCPILSDYENF